MKSSEIYHVCSRCGTLAHVATELARGVKLSNIKPRCAISTFHHGICDCCGHETSVTEVRDFYYPDFALINRKHLKTYNYAKEPYEF